MEYIGDRAKLRLYLFFFFFNNPPTPEIYPLPLPAPLPIETAATIGASASGGPYPASNIQFRFGDRKFYVDAVGRDNPGGAVEVLNITSGRWPDRKDRKSTRLNSSHSQSRMPASSWKKKKNS